MKKYQTNSSLRLSIATRNLFLLLILLFSATALSLRPGNRFHPHRALSTRSLLTLSATPTWKMLDTIKLTPILIALSTSFPVDSASALDKMSKETETCMSKCVFEETKPPPLGSKAERLLVQRSRVDIIQDCKAMCKTPSVDR